MPDSQLYTLEAANTLAGEVKTALATSKLRLGDNTFVPTASSTRTQLRAHEIASDGYPAGGYALAAFTGPLNDPSGGAVITSPLVNVSYNTPSDPPVTAQVGYWWVEDTGGDVRFVGIFDPSRALAMVGDGWPQVVQAIYGKNPVPVG